MAPRLRLPTFTAFIEMPAMLDPQGAVNSRVNRVHARVVKNSLDKTLREHRRVNLQKHFQSGNRFRYSHAPRKSVTRIQKIKRGQGNVDNVKTRRTRNKMRRQITRIRKSGNVAGGAITATLSLKFPVGFKQKSGGITKKQIATEIGQWAPDEQRAMAEYFKRQYVRGINRELKSARVRRRFGARLAALGIVP